MSFYNEVTNSTSSQLSKERTKQEYKASSTTFPACFYMDIAHKVFQSLDSQCKSNENA